MDVMETWEPVLTTGPLLGIAAAAVALILVMVIYFKVHAFIVLTIVSTLTALIAGIPLEGVVPTLTKGLWFNAWFRCTVGWFRRHDRALG